MRLAEPAGREFRRMMRRQRLFALIDACDLEIVPAFLHALGEERAVSLYKGRHNDEDWAIGAYLAAVDALVLDWIGAELPADSWGVLVESGRSLEELLTHFQQFVTLLSPDGEEWFFRFYDPRVLPVYLESVTPEEREQFCAGVERLGTIGPGAEARLVVHAGAKYSD